MSDYTLNSNRVSYHGGLALATPLAVDLRAPGGARYVVEGRLCQLGRDGVLRAVVQEERRAA